MGFFLNALQISAIFITVVGIYFLSRKEQNKMSMYLMLSSVGCLIVNCSYLLLMRSGTAQEGMLAMRMESVGNTMLYYFLHMFVIEYLKIRRVKQFMPLWLIVDCLNTFFFWNDETMSLVYKNVMFIFDERMGIMHIIREMGVLQMIRSAMIAFVMMGTLIYMLFRLLLGKIQVRSERNNLARLIGADFVIVGIMTITMLLHHSFNLTPICTSFAILTIVQGVFKGELLSAVDTGREWVVENMQSAFVVVDPAYGYMDANTFAKEMFPQLRMLPRNDRVDQTLYGIFHEEGSMVRLGERYYEKTIEPVKQGKEIVGYGLILNDVTGQQVLLEEVRSAQQRAEDANEAKSAFMSNMSHEIRTPMNAIVGMTDILLRSELPEQERGYLQNIRNSGNALLSIINDILDFSKIESNRLEIVEDDYDPMSLLHDLSMIFLNRIGEKPIELLYDIDACLPARLHGDVLRIRQVIINLMNNAVKFTERGHVKLTIAVTERCGETITLHIAVEDSGQGIKEEDLPKLFGAYQQVDTKKNHAKEGTGLGLAISRNLVELMGGTFSVESEYGVGSRFSFTLTQQVKSVAQAAAVKQEVLDSGAAVSGRFTESCLRQALEALTREYGLRFVSDQEIGNARIDHFFTDDRTLLTAGEISLLRRDGAQITLLQNPMLEAEPAADMTAISKPLYSFNFCRIINRESVAIMQEQRAEQFFIAPRACILVVDDNELNRKVAQGLLEPLQMQIDTADNGKNALTKIARKHYDLIFMDHMMPVMDGIEATKKLREMDGEYFRTVPVIALTANVVNEAKDQFRAAGMNDFAAKPIKFKEIIDILKRWLPPEHIKYAGENTAAPRETEPEEFPAIDGLDTAEGIRNSGSPKLFYSLLADFYHLIDMKSEKIEKCLADGLLRDYTIEVHALKNTARLIGAQELSREFLELEQLGNAEDSAALHEKTPAVIAHYRSYKPILKPYAAASRQEKTAAADDEIIAALERISKAIDAFDLDGADEAMRLLETYALPDELSDSMERLRALIADVAMEEVMELTGNMIDFLSK